MKKIDKIISQLEKKHPDAGIALKYSDNFQLLVVVILSAQCTDERVNMVTSELFKLHPGVKDFAQIPVEKLEKLIYSTGFYKNKAKNIKAAARMILEKFEGIIPDNMSDLLKLPGVARKTANVILYNGFSKTEGITVDTHVIRVSGKLALIPEKYVKQKNAVKIEAELMRIVPKKYWGRFSDLMIFHGRRICIARKPKCKICPLNGLCPSAEL